MRKKPGGRRQDEEVKQGHAMPMRGRGYHRNGWRRSRNCHRDEEAIFRKFLIKFRSTIATLSACGRQHDDGPVVAAMEDHHVRQVGKEEGR
jgi:hypothetical protein